MSRLRYLTPSLIVALFLLPVAIQCCCLDNFPKTSGCCDTQPSSSSDCLERCLSEREESFLSSLPHIPGEIELQPAVLVERNSGPVLVALTRSVPDTKAFYPEPLAYSSSLPRAPPHNYL